MRWRVLLDKKILIKENEQVTFSYTSKEEMERVSIEVTLEKKAHFFADFIINNKKTNLHISCVLVGADAQATINGKIVTAEHAEHVITTEQIHKAPDTESTILLKGTVNKEAVHSFNGLIRLEKGSLRAIAQQDHKVLLLHKEASAISVPSLQVLHDDVQCGHGSVVSYVNCDDLYALQLRGIKAYQAHTMIIKGFLS